MNKNAYDLAANYNNGPLSLGAGYSYWNSNYQAALRGLYTFGQFTVGAYDQRNKDEATLFWSQVLAPATTSACPACTC